MLSAAFVWLAVLSPLALVSAQGQPAPAAAAVDFDRDVRPLLADRCFTCHGPDEARRKAGLRLDDEASAKAARKDGKVAIVPGDLDHSELWRRVNAHDDDRMPPVDSKLVLAPAEIARLGAWIAQGARYATHWSLRPLPDAVAVPTRDGVAAEHPVDAFLRARLQDEGLVPAPPASKTRLLRRATFALTGLPPTPEDIDAFVADASADAFARVLDRLLASPRYGEHMAVTWLDAARYADTYGYQSDVYREVWPWRDWVVDAFNDNLPYDRFVTWQLAGDLLPDATREQILATCFSRLHRQTNEGGSVEEEFRVEYVCDRVETLGSAVLGLTLGCARCHDHKFDPLTQREFYGLTALFDDIDECGLYSHFTNAVPTPTLMLPTPEQEKALAAAEAARCAAAIEVERALHGDVLSPQGFDDWLAQPGKRPEVVGCVGHLACEDVADGKVANMADAGKPGRVDGGLQVVAGKVGNALRFDGECSVTLPKVADFTAYDEFTIALWLKVDAIKDRAVVLHRSRAWTDAGSRGYELLLEDGRPSFALIHFWPGNAVRIRAKAPLQPGRWYHLAVSSAGYGRADGLGIFVDGRRAEVEVVRDSLTKTITGGGAEALVVGARFRDCGLAGGEIDELRVYSRVLTGLEVDLLAGGSRLATALAQRGFQEGHQLHDELASYYRASHPDDFVADCAAYRKAIAGVTAVRDQIREIMVMRDDHPRTAHVLKRGAYDQRGDTVEADLPASLPPWPHDAPRNRLGLARWLCDPHHPLTARVAVNRIWQMHFGQGLVRTQEDFGVQGSPPSHPALLDWLARWFVASGWDVKALHRLILTSQTWQQASVASPALRERDPDNVLLARGPRLRLSAEMVRDAALFTGGLLVEKRGGPPVKPYQPPGLWEEKSGAHYERDVGEGSHRRSLYTFWKRTSPPPAMTLFDAPDREVCAQRRQRTTTPLQALVLMNDPQFVEAARGLATRTLKECGADVDTCVRAMYRRVLGEPPDAVAATALRTLWQQQSSRFAGAPQDAAALLAVGDEPHADPSLDAAAQAAATMVASAIYSADEAVVLR